MMEALSSCEKSVLTRATPHNIPEDEILELKFVFVVKRERERECVCRAMKTYREAWKYSSDYY
jgi:hypothetical protein